MNDVSTNRSPDKVKVLFVAGHQRSGSTIFTKVLGEARGVFAAGEVMMLWDRLYVDHRPCGCNRPVSECPVWQEILSNAFGPPDRPGAYTRLRRQGGLALLPLMFLPFGRRVAKARYAEYLHTLDALYRSIHEVTGSEVIVDSSKGPGYEFLLSLVPGIDFYVVNVVRDPRGVQYSMLRRQREGAPKFRNHSVITSSLSWTARNLLHELQSLHHRRKYLTIRYEEFVAEPTQALTRTLQLVGEPPSSAPSIVDGTLDVETNHIMGGSRNRKESGTVTLRLDDAWMTRLEDRAQKLTTLLTYPLLRLYGFPTTLARASGNATSTPEQST